MSSLRPTRLVAVLVALVLAVSACASEPPTVIVSGNDPATSAKDIPETLATNGYTIFSALLERAGMTDLLTQGEGEESFTVFAPSDAAFAEMGAGVDAVLMGEEDVIVVPLSDVAAAAEVESPEDQAAEDGEASSTAGPESAVPSSSASQAPAGTVAQGQISDEAPAMSESETTDLLSAILEYHLVEGTRLAADIAGASSLPTLEGTDLTVGSREEEPTTEGGEPTTVLTVDQADVTDGDLFATNGVIHAIDQVLVPADRAEELRALIASIPVATDVMNTLRLTREHTQLVAAIEAAGLVADVEGAEEITIFAPTDAAFDALSDEQRAALADPEVLRDVLLFHAVPRAVSEENVLNSESVATLQGERVTVTKEGDAYSVDEVPIDRQIPATNGFVQVIGQILVPPTAQGPGGL